jgi:hypothetical protein
MSHGGTSLRRSGRQGAAVAAGASPDAAQPRLRLRANIALVLLALLLLAVLSAVSGRIEVNNGRGWDGNSYAAMLERGWDAGTANTSLRPFIILLNRPLYSLTGDAIATFGAMNYLYVALLVVVSCLLFDRYNDDPAAKVLFVANVLLCVSTLKMISYYPVLIDVGACAFLALALYLIVSGRRWMAGAACVAAVLSREFGVAAILFGGIRDLRQRVPVRTVALTYAPAFAAWIGWRLIVMDHWSGRDAILTGGTFLGNLADWLDPRFVSFFLYFLVTIFGGASIFVFSRLGAVYRHVRREPEWAVFSAALVAAAMVGSWDIWRYLAFLLPACAVFFAVAAREIGLPRRQLALAAVISTATLLTQRPAQPIDLVAYFRDWFPYYVLQGTTAHNAPVPPAIWPLWGWRFGMAAVLVLVVAALPLLNARSLHATRA